MLLHGIFDVLEFFEASQHLLIEIGDILGQFDSLGALFGGVFLRLLFIHPLLELHGIPHRWSIRGHSFRQVKQTETVRFFTLGRSGVVLRLIILNKSSLFKLLTQGCTGQFVLGGLLEHFYALIRVCISRCYLQMVRKRKVWMSLFKLNCKTKCDKEEITFHADLFMP
nr:MAG TPA: hypothetical protein [Caudoviricetes sp.]